ncbi:MAG: GNAT family N-acetyltransferase [Candidatus Bathyarchaeota archaeon]|nr:GNAT family N-acetyltransferase [Candidatus Bathyarchaeota archaeon]
MKEQNIPILHEKVAIAQLTSKFVLDLMSNNMLASSGALNQGLRHRMLQAIKVIPNATKLVAYHTENKRAIGFLVLEENTDWLYSIKYVFVDPKYRKMGLGTRLVTYAMILAKEKGAKKVNLNVYLTHTKTIDLYRKLGFREIGPTLLGQGFLSASRPLRMIKRATLGMGHLTKLTLIKKGRLIKLQTNSKKNRKTLFRIYHRCMDQKWMDFFEINTNNLINGSRHVWQPPFFRDVLINDLGNSFALIFSQPFFQKATVELYSTSDAIIPSILEELLKILANRGISFTQITVFNPSDTVSLNWFKERGMRTFHFIGMGRTL